jgi:hypothetical protein
MYSAASQPHLTRRFMSSALGPFSLTPRFPAFLISPFFEMGESQLCIKMMHTAFFYFNYSAKAGKERYIELINQSHQTKVSKHQQASTKLEE